MTAVGRSITEGLANIMSIRKSVLTIGAIVAATAFLFACSDEIYQNQAEDITQEIVEVGLNKTEVSANGERNDRIESEPINRRVEQQQADHRLSGQNIKSDRPIERDGNDTVRRSAVLKGEPLGEDGNAEDGDNGETGSDYQPVDTDAWMPEYTDMDSDMNGQDMDFYAADNNGNTDGEREHENNPISIPEFMGNGNNIDRDEPVEYVEPEGSSPDESCEDIAGAVRAEDAGLSYPEDTTFIEEDTTFIEEDATFIEEDATSGMIYLGEYTISFYCECSICCGEWAYGATASGAMPTAWHTVASGQFDFGTQLYIDGLGYFVVEDRGVDGNWLDVFVDDHNEALSLGLQSRSVYLVG